MSLQLNEYVRKLLYENDRLQNDINNRLQTLNILEEQGNKTEMEITKRKNLSSSSPIPQQNSQLAPKIAQLAVVETTTEEKYYSLLDDCKNLIELIPDENELKEDTQKLLDLNQEVCSLRLKLHDLENTDIPALPIHEESCEDEAELSIDSRVIFDEEPLMPEIGKQMELKSLDTTIKNLKTIIEAKSNSLINYTATYDSHVKNMIAMNTKNAKVSPMMLKNIKQSIADAEAAYKQDKEKIEDLKYSNKVLEAKLAEKQKEMSLNAVDLVNEMKEMKQKSLELEPQYELLLKEYEVLNRYESKMITEKSISDLEKTKEEYIRRTKIYQEQTDNRYSYGFMFNKDYMTRLLDQNGELDKKIKDNKARVSNLKYKISKLKRKLELENKRVPKSILDEDLNQSQ